MGQVRYGSATSTPSEQQYLHRCLQRYGISRLPDIEGDKPKRQRFKRYLIGFFHMDNAEVQTAEGKLYSSSASTAPASSPSPGPSTRLTA